MTYLLRVSLDIEVNKNLASSPRSQAAVKTIKSLNNRKNKIVILAHRGRPNGFEKKLSLKPFQSLFNRNLKKRVVFFPRFNFVSIRKRVSQAPKGSIFLLENLRFLDGETKNDSLLARELAGLGDFYINDDFPTSHRKNASNVGIARILPSRLGPNFKIELNNLDKIKNPKKPLVVIIGGAKMTDKIGAIKNLLPKAHYILLGGGPANTFLKATGIDIGRSIYEPHLVKTAKILSKNKKVILPLDWKISQNRILDVGPTTIDYYSQFIRRAKTIIWNGPMGLFEKSGFETGTYEIAKAVAKSRAFKVVGGGETTQVIYKLKLEKKINFVSTGGGAMLEYLAGKKLPAIEALKR